MFKIGLVVRLTILKLLQRNKCSERSDRKLIFSLCEHFGTEVVIINRTEDVKIVLGSMIQFRRFDRGY